MAGARACVLLSLALFGAARAVSDESCLVQSHRDVTVQGPDALKPEAPAQHPEALVQLHAKLHEVRRQLPFDLPAGMNVSMEQLMSVGMEFLSLFKNDTIVAVMEEGMRNISKGLLTYGKQLDHAIELLRSDVENATDVMDVWKAMYNYVSAQNVWFAGMTSDVLLDPRKLVSVLPVGSALRNMSMPVVEAGKALTKDIINGYLLHEMIQPTIDLFKHDFCGKFEPVVVNLNKMANFLTMHSADTMQDMRNMLPQVLPMIEGFSPEAAPKFSKMMNSSMAGMEEVMDAYAVTLPHAVTVLREVIDGRLGCACGAQMAQTGAAAPAGARRGLVLAAVAAAAAWIFAA